MPDHPDHEQLAAFQAGDGDRRERTDVEAHLAGCPSCAEVVASVELARTRLAVLEEPELPPGLHDRLAAAVASEAAETVADGPTSRSSGPAGHEILRPTPWYRRPVAWGAAAALLLAALVVPFLDQSADLTTAGGGGGGADMAQVAGDEVPLFNLPGEVTAGTVRARLAADRQAKAALDSAADDALGAQSAAGESQGAPATQSPDPDREEGYRSSASIPQTAPADLQPCLPAAAAAADPATRPLVPAFYIEGAYRGRDATILVTTSSGQPDRVDLWVFPRNDCTLPPIATERVR